MAKKANWISNLRVDIPDLEQGTHGYAGELSKEFLDRTFKDSYPRVVEGFRVEIADIANRVITVYSGVASDQDGQLINNEESLTTSRSITLGGDATYYIEVEFIENLGNTDARAFWDTSFDNGLDTSGDILPDGRESSQNVATRKTHDWQIVSPPSTTNFQITTSASGVRVPVAIITVFGGDITAPSATSIARTTFARTYSSGKTSIRGLNTRIFPDTFTARLGSGTANTEDISVTANDRENGILTLGAGTTKAHNVGERILNQGSTVLFIDEAVAMDETTGVDGGGPVPNVAGDGRVRMFQGDTEAGFALSQDPSSDTGESDIQIKNLKEQVDFLASQVLEIKYGAGSRDLLGTLAPPNAFAVADTMHFSRSGGIIPARGHTVSVGNGVTSWGDYNTTTSGSALDAIQDAVDALPATGGIIYIKEGTYTITTTAIAIVDKPVWFIGDGRDATIIDATGAVSAIDFDTATVTVEWSSMLRMDSMSVTYSGGFSGVHVMTCTGAGSRMMLKNCRIYGIDATIEVGKSTFENCLFRQSTAGTGSVLQGRFNECTFTRCFFDMDAATSTLRAVEFTTSTNRILFEDCKFSVNVAAVAQVELAANADNIVFRDCEFQAGGGVSAIIMTAVGGSDIVLDHCKVVCDGGMIFETADTVRLLHSSFAVPQNGSSVIFENDCRDIVVRDCIFTQATTTALEEGIGLDLAGIAGGRVDGCHFIDCDIGIGLHDVGDGSSQPHGTIISCCQFTSISNDRGRIGIGMSTNAVSAAANPGIDDLRISDCTIFGLDDPSVTEIYGINIQSGNGVTANAISIRGCNISNIGDGATVTAAGILLGANAGSGTGNLFFNCQIENNRVDTVFSGTGAANEYGVYVANNARCSISGNMINNLNSPIYTINGTDLVIVGNYVAAFSLKGIDVNGLAATTKHVTISSNVINAGANTSLTQLIDVSDVSYLAITCNTLFATQGTTLAMIDLSDVAGFSVTGNQITFTGTSTTLDGVKTDATTTRGVISGNVIDLGSGPTAGFCVNQTGTPDSVLISGNMTHHNTSGTPGDRSFGVGSAIDDVTTAGSSNEGTDTLHDLNATI